MPVKITNFFMKYSDKITLVLFGIWTFVPFIVLVFSRMTLYIKPILWYSLFSIIGVILVLISLLKVMNKKDYKKFLLLFIFFLWSALCSFKASNFSFAIYGNSYRQEGLLTYFLYGGYFITAFYLVKKDYVLKFMKLLSIASVLLCLFQYILGPIENTSIFYQFNHFGYYLMISVIATIFNFKIEKVLSKKIFYFIIYLYLLYELIINNTFGCYLALLITLTIYFIYSIFMKKNFKYILVLLFSFLILSLIVKDDSGEIIAKQNITVFINDIVTIVTGEDMEAIEKAGTSRGILWKKGIEFIMEKPIFGYGLDGVGDEYQMEDIATDRPHNIIIQMALFTGIPGMIMYIGFVIFLYVKKLIMIRKSDELGAAMFFITVCYFISSMFGNSMYYTSPYYLIFLGFLMRNIYSKKEKLSN